MTLVAVWRAENRLMAIADTRIIRSAGNVLTEHGPKLLPIKVQGKQPGVSGFFDRPAFQFDIGFAYSGATLPALSTHALANILLGNLAGTAGTPPSMAEIAFLICGVSAEYMREVEQLNGPSAQTHSKDSRTTIPWARSPPEPPRFIVGFTKGGETTAAPSV